MANRTQIVCLHEGKKGSVDSVFINRLLRSLEPSWIRPWSGSNIVRLEPCGGRINLISRFPKELRGVLAAGGNTTLMVWADADHDMADCDSLKGAFWEEAQKQSITRPQFDQVVFAFAKDRIENWIEFLNTGITDESQEGPRVKNGADAAKAARTLADHCSSGAPIPNIPPSLEWSCRNWRALADRLRQ